MKINKGMSVLLASMLIGGMLVGCSNNSNSDTTKASTKTVKEVTKDDTEVEVTKDKEKEFPPQDNNKSSEKQVNTKKDNTTVKKDTKKEEPKKEEPKKEKPIYDEYGYDQYGNYDPNKDLHNDREWNDDDYKRWEEAHGEDCSICGGHVGVKEMCECDGTIHHRSCHVDAYTCPSCNRYGLKHDPDIYGCPYCGYPVEDYDDYDDEPIEEPSDTYEIENYNEEEECYE